MIIKDRDVAKKIIEIAKKQTIYHYCSMESFYHIIDGNNVRLTSSAKMNDKKEGTWIEKYFSMISLDQEKKDKLMELYYNIPNHAFLSCFSASGDKLSQWRAYADDGRGVAIGLNIGSLGVEIKAPEINDFQKNNKTVSLFSVVYNEDRQRKMFNHLVNVLFKDIELMRMDYLANEIKAMSYIFKSNLFSEEEEFRLIYYPFLARNIENLLIENIVNEDNFICRTHFRNTKRGISPYFPFEFPEESLVEIVLGPQNESEEFDVFHFLKCKSHNNPPINYDISKIKIRKSDVEYLNYS